ncbi:hypothetical protein [Mycoplasmopsis agassizii]|uniref:Uncharacterized protein n=1 Tax=Mycoplasmopsis agassizii TaxID=33922 RepID=A0ABX4H6C7_9BACT|nr:hypothetical protein [Mycoplasmopsis agassizii]PAF55377.1 hypothetical protein CJF60_01655 [Mycoplasmopsis agassizii]SMC20335.1 hypothetical protein SAMN02745179_01013 [Mycoplasmopsis agassizii]
MKSEEFVLFKKSYVHHKDKDKFLFHKAGKKILYLIRDEALVNYEANVDEQNSDLDFVSQISKGKKTNSGLFKLVTNDFGITTSKEIQPDEAISNVKLLNDKQFIWEGVISLSNEMANKYKFGKQSDFAKLINTYIPPYLKANNFKIDDLHFYFVVHANTKNPHSHIYFFEKQANYLADHEKVNYRGKGAFKKSSINDFKKFTTEYIKNKNALQELRLKRESLWDSKSAFKQLLKKFSHGYSEVLLVNDLLAAYKSGKKTFAAIGNKLQTRLIDYFETKYSSDANLKANYDKWKDAIQELKTSQLGKKVAAKEVKELRQFIGNKMYSDIMHSFFESKKLQKSINDQKFNDKLKKSSLLDSLKNLNTYMDKYSWDKKIKALQTYHAMMKGNSYEER